MENFNSWKISKPGLVISAILISVSLFANNSPKIYTELLKKEIESILLEYVTDYQNDVTLIKGLTFGIKIDDYFWHVMTHEETNEVKLIFGKPNTPVFYFYTDHETLENIHQGKLNALTASAKAFDTDFAPFDVDVMEGFTPDETFMDTLFSVYFHFWTKGQPETIPFSINKTRMTHGAQAAIFYYQPGFRSAYVALKQGQHANEDKNSQTNPFPTMLIIIKGKGDAIINGKKSTVQAGEAIVIPKGMKHEFMNPYQEPMEAILLMFGKGA